MNQKINPARDRSIAIAFAIAAACLPALAAPAAESPARISVPGTASSTFSIDHAIRLALEHNPELRAASGRVSAASGRAYQAKLWTNPELELSAEDWPASRGGGFSDAKQTVGIAQTLPYPGKKSLDKRIGGAGVKLSEAELALRRTEVVRDVKAAFYRVLASERLVDASRELLTVAESSSETARKRVEAGAAAYQEQLRAEVQRERARTELAEKERELATARVVLGSVVGRPEARQAQLSGALPEGPQSGLMQADAQGLLERHPSAAAARAMVERAELEYRRARLEPYPDVRVAAAGGRIGETDESIIEFGVSFPIPILDRGKGKRQEAQANVKVAEAELAGVRQQLEREWSKAQRRYRTAAEQVDNYRERLLPKANEALKLVQTGFEEGKFGFMDLVDTQRTAAEARLAYQEKLLELSIAQAELEALVQPEP